MRQIFTYILALLFVLSCSKAPRSESSVFTDKIEEVGMVADESIEVFKEFDIENTTSLNTILKQKLQEYHDLLLLEKTNPEFSNEIKEQLKKLSDEKLDIDSIEGEVSIRDILFLSSAEKISDSIQKIKFSYRANTKTDSLTAIVKTIPIVIENQTIWSTSILFEKQRK